MDLTAEEARTILEELIDAETQPTMWGSPLFCRLLDCAAGLPLDRAMWSHGREWASVPTAAEYLEAVAAEEARQEAARIQREAETARRAAERKAMLDAMTPAERRDFLAEEMEANDAFIHAIAGVYRGGPKDVAKRRKTLASAVRGCIGGGKR